MDGGSTNESKVQNPPFPPLGHNVTVRLNFQLMQIHFNMDKALSRTTINLSTCENAHCCNGLFLDNGMLLDA